VVGHRKRNLLERWWSGATGAYIVDNLDCSLLVARQAMSDQDFEAKLGSLA
jgi:nucleotide-binding universal stress UspA family protein